MNAWPDDLSRRLAVIAQQELEAILRSTGEVDTAFFHGRRHRCVPVIASPDAVNDVWWSAGLDQTSEWSNE